jgi:DNA repair protein RecO (recombination protein O)
VPSYQTNAIVIGRTNFGEADRIIRIITPDCGKLSAIAKGVRRIKSRSGGHLELFSDVALTLAKGRNLDVVTSARLAWYPHALAESYERLGLAFMTASMVDRLVEENHPQSDIYELTSEMLHLLEAGQDGKLPELWFKLRLLQLLGYRPELRACLACGQAGAAASYSFSSERGGIVCEPCREATATPMSHPVIKLWRILSDHPFANVTGISGAESLAGISLSDCDGFYQYHLGRAFSADPIGVTS